MVLKAGYRVGFLDLDTVGCYLQISHCFKLEMACKLRENTCASAGNRTRVDCLEGNHANPYTTDAYV